MSKINNINSEKINLLSYMKNDRSSVLEKGLGFVIAREDA